MFSSIPTQPIQVTTLEDEQQQWVDEHEDQGNDVFKMTYFNCMPIGTKLIGYKIRDTPTNQTLGDDQS